MKNTLLLIVLCLTLCLSAQIQYNGCTQITGGFTYPITLTQSGTVGARNTYTSGSLGACNAGVCSFRIIWNTANNAWEIQLSNNGGTSFNNVLYRNTTASAPNPPDISLGTWQDVSGVNCGSLISLTGDVQSTVNSCNTFVNIPDANFKAILVADVNINTDGDNEICTTEAQAYTGPIGVSFSNISDLTGIEAFTNITALECQDNQITTLDVSNNTQLTRLYCYNNALTTLIIGQNTIINRIECSVNQLTSLDVSLCPSLLLFTCASNQLTSLNVANGNNGNISTLEANSNPNLTCIQHDAGFTPPGHDGISGWLKDATANWSDNCAASSCTTFVNIPDANFKAVLVANSAINTDGDTEICITEAQAYTGAIFVANQGISDLTGIEVFTQITELYCDENTLTNLDISANTALTILTCDLNQLTSLDVSNNTLLTEISCGGNQLTSLDVTTNTALISLFCGGNQIPSLDVSSNINLERLNCAGNQLTALNVANTNNGNMTLMSAITNSNLTCIQHDNGFNPTTNSNWVKDATASWSTNCANLSVADVSFNNTITMYPNPASTILNITSNDNTIESVEVYNIIGKKVIDTTSQSIDISTLTNGIYITKIKSDNNRFAIKKFVKQ